MGALPSVSLAREFGRVRNRLSMTWRMPMSCSTDGSSGQLEVNTRGQGGRPSVGRTIPSESRIKPRPNKTCTKQAPTGISSAQNMHGGSAGGSWPTFIDEYRSALCRAT